jgi:MFS family permease
MSEALPQPSARVLNAAYGMGVFGIALLDLYAMLVPLYALKLGLSATEIGILLGARGVLPTFFSIHGGSLMDRLGTRRVTLACAAITAVMALIFPSTGWFPLLVLIQLISGLTTTFSWIGAQTLIAQITYGDPVPLGRFNFFCRFGTIGAPLIAGFLWDVTGAWPTFGMVAAWAGLLCLLTYVVPEPNAELKAGPRPSLTSVLPRLSDYTRSFALMLVPVIAFTVVVSGLRNAGTSMQNSIYVVYLEGVGFDGTMIGILFAALEVTTGFASLYVSGVKKLGGPEFVLLGTTALSVALMAITPFLGGILLLLILMQLLRGLCQGFMQPLMYSIQSTTAGKEFQGAVVGLRMTANRIISAILPPIMGFLADRISLNASFVLTGLLVMLACAALGWLVIARPEFRTSR